MHELLAAHSLNLHPLPPSARFAGLLAPPVAGGAGASTHPAGPVDPLVVGIVLIALGVLYALALLVAVALLHHPRHQKWPECVGQADQADAKDGVGAGRPAHGFRPLVAHRAPGARPPACGTASGVHAGARDIAADTGAASASGSASNSRFGQQSHGTPAWPDDIAWRSVEYEVPEVGLVQLDARTVHAFAGQPEVLRRLAFQRWRYQAGRCSEFTPPEGTAHPGKGAGAARGGPQADPHGRPQDGSASTSRPSVPRRPGAWPHWITGHEAPVPHSTGGEPR